MEDVKNLDSNNETIENAHKVKRSISPRAGNRQFNTREFVERQLSKVKDYKMVTTSELDLTESDIPYGLTGRWVRVSKGVGGEPDFQNVANAELQDWEPAPLELFPERIQRDLLGRKRGNEGFVSAGDLTLFLRAAEMDKIDEEFYRKKVRIANQNLGVDEGIGHPLKGYAESGTRTSQRYQSAIDF